MYKYIINLKSIYKVLKFYNLLKLLQFNSVIYVFDNINYKCLNNLKSPITSNN